MLEIYKIDPPDESNTEVCSESDANITPDDSQTENTGRHNFKNNIKISDLDIKGTGSFNFRRNPAVGILNGLLISIPLWIIIIYAIKNTIPYFYK